MLSIPAFDICHGLLDLLLPMCPLTLLLSLEVKLLLNLIPGFSKASTVAPLVISSLTYILLDAGESLELDVQVEHG